MWTCSYMGLPVWQQQMAARALFLALNKKQWLQSTNAVADQQLPLQLHLSWKQNTFLENQVTWENIPPIFLIETEKFWLQLAPPNPKLPDRFHFKLIFLFLQIQNHQIHFLRLDIWGSSSGHLLVYSLSS